MAYEHFKPTIWSKYIQHELKKFTVFEKDCNYQFKGEVGKGKTVKILGVSTPAIGDYNIETGIGKASTVADSSQLLVIDQAKYFNFMVDDVDEAQSQDGLMEALMEEATRAMAECRDTFIANVAAGQVADSGTLAEGMVSESTAITTASAATAARTAKAAIDKALQKLWENGVSQKDDVTIYLNPAVYLLFQEYITETKTDNDKAIASGILGNYSGAKVKMSNNFYNDGTDDYMFVKTSKAIAFCSGIDEVEAYRPEEYFSDAIKGLNTYGARIVRPKELYVIKAH